MDEIWPLDETGSTVGVEDEREMRILDRSNR